MGRELRTARPPGAATRRSVVRVIPSLLRGDVTTARFMHTLAAGGYFRAAGLVPFLPRVSNAHPSFATLGHPGRPRATARRSCRSGRVDLGFRESVRPDQRRPIRGDVRSQHGAHAHPPRRNDVRRHGAGAGAAVASPVDAGRVRDVELCAVDRELWGDVRWSRADVGQTGLRHVAYPRRRRKKHHGHVRLPR